MVLVMFQQGVYRCILNFMFQNARFVQTGVFIHVDPTLQESSTRPSSHTSYTLRNNSLAIGKKNPTLCNENKLTFQLLPICSKPKLVLL
jgi:hypothetical protein